MAAGLTSPQRSTPQQRVINELNSAPAVTEGMGARTVRCLARPGAAQTVFLPQDNVVVGPIDLPCAGVPGVATWDSSK